MYQFLLTKRYLLSKIMPLFAVGAVMLCTAMVLVVWSVMGGFVNMLIGSGRTMTGDVVIAWPNAGFAYYDELIKDLEKHPSVAAAAPTIETFGLAAFPSGLKQAVTVKGIVPESYGRVTSYFDILYWKPQKDPLKKDTEREDPRINAISGLSWAQIQENGRTMTRAEADGTALPGIVMGIEVSGMNYRHPRGYYLPEVKRRLLSTGEKDLVDMFMPRDGKVLLSVAPLDGSGRAVQMESRNLPVANEFQSGLYEVDSHVVLVPLALAQDMLMMDAARRVTKPGTGAVNKAGPSGTVVTPEAAQANANGPESFEDTPGQQVEVDPPRVTHVLVRGKGAVDSTAQSQALKAAVEEVYDAFAARHMGEVPPGHAIVIRTWEEQNGTMISAVKKETVLLLVLFMIISLVAVFLILAIFWAMVAEKTRDIGILRAVGAGSGGVAALWVAYGVTIGVVGSTLGLGVSYLVVHNINPIHDWLGTALEVTIWDPSIYYFITIPNQVESDKAVLVFLAGIFASALGAFIPAIRAALMDPVRALRFE